MAAGKPAVLKVDVRADTAAAKSELGGFDGFVAGITASITNLGLNAVGQLGQFALDFAVDIFNAGQAAADAVDHLERVFQDGALNIILAWSGVSAQTFGVISTEFQEMATKFGRVLTGMGVDQTTAANLIVETATLAADMAETYGITWAQAFDVLSNAALGKFRGIQQYAGLIGEDAVAAAETALEAAGNAEGTDAATLAVARLHVAFDALGGVQGAFKEDLSDADGAAKQASLAFEQMKTDIGVELTPVMNEFMTQVLVPLTNFLVEHKDTIISVANAVVFFAKASIVSLEILGSTIGWFVGLWNWAWGLIEGAVAAVVPWLLERWGDLNEAAVWLADTVENAIGRAVDAWHWLQSVIGGIVDFISDQVDRAIGLFDTLRGMVESLPGGGLFAGAADALTGGLFTSLSGFTASQSGPPRIDRAGASGNVSVFGAVTGDQIATALARYTKTTATLAASGIRIS